MKISISHEALLGYIGFFSVILLAAWMRFTGVNWDMGYYLHPDERFLNMVGTAIRLPKSFPEYLDPAISPLNPANNGYLFFVYGLLPLTLNKLLAVMLNLDTYQWYGLLGRILSASFDMVTLVMVFQIGRLLQKQYRVKAPLGLVAMFFYAIAVLPVQLSHFFTSDIIHATFLTVALYLSLRSFYLRELPSAVFAVILCGLAVASKVSALFMAPLILLFAVLGVLKSIYGEAALGSLMHVVRMREIKNKGYELSFDLEPLRGLFKKRHMMYVITMLLVMLVGGYLAVRNGSPYYFQSGNLLDLRISELFIKNIKELKGFDSYEGFFPPAIQWMTKTPPFLVQNLIIFGIGIPYAVLCIAGIGVALARYRRSLFVWASVLWLIAFIGYNSFTFIKVMRYLIFAYPLLALAAATGAVWIGSRWGSRAMYMGLALSLVYPLMFMNIYMKPHSRVSSSVWIHQNIPDGSLILQEHWDDGQPMPIPGSTRNYTGIQMEVFVPDSDEKFLKIENELANADYYIPSSNRAWGSIGDHPAKYPRMSEWYKKMLSGQMGYTKIKEFTVYPSLEWMGIPLTLPDQWADESFTVYDHPKVMVYQNTIKRPLNKGNRDAEK